MADTAITGTGVTGSPTTQTGGELAVDRKHMAFEMDQGVYARAAIGLIVLASDQTVQPA